MRTKQELLLLPIWTYHEIMDYFPSVKSKTTAIRIKRRAIREHNGSVFGGTYYVKTDSVLALYGTTRKQELDLIRNIDNEKVI